jgi:hypothetical protein
MTTDQQDEPSDADVIAAIDELADRAKRSGIGTSGHAWGRLAEVDRLANVLKTALTVRRNRPQEQPDQETRG